MIDFHSHILPELDDGASSLDVTVAMLDELARLGFRTVVATPHLTGELTTAYDDAVTQALDAVRPLAAARGIELVRGFEVRLSLDLPARLRGGEPVAIGESTAVLVDLAAGGWPHDLDEVLYNVRASGFRPVLAHPERYPKMQKRPRHARELAERGVMLQVTIASFAGVFGRQTRKAAEALLREGAVHLVATDAHSAGHRLAAVPAGLGRLEQRVGSEAFHRLAISAPAALLNDDEPPPTVRSHRRSVGVLDFLRRGIASSGR